MICPHTHFRILKYPLLSGVISQWVLLPCGSKIIHVGEQDGQLFIWAKTFVGELKKMSRGIEIYGTGHSYHLTNLEHLGTVQMKDGFVWHIYEKLPWRPE